jgi:hypothetical protein
LDEKNCGGNDPLLQANWTVWDGKRLVDKGSAPSIRAGKFADKHMYALLGRFTGEAGKKYVVEVKFTMDGTPLNIANPHLIVIQHSLFW